MFYAKERKRKLQMTSPDKSPDSAMTTGSPIAAPSCFIAESCLQVEKVKREAASTNYGLFLQSDDFSGQVHPQNIEVRLEGQ